ncbi:hypothetical protein JTE90_012727 [Oedothorax gibbosus]|uniref:Uncharacterized protein n=1 Tax=Oedothorax gibbosus TaxID=931172 RepID=A0AAV6W2H4_9ARAC|nr:hypothetical protein JTE90_012727 [Oedothorax gibbosus]
MLQRGEPKDPFEGLNDFSDWSPQTSKRLQGRRVIISVSNHPHDDVSPRRPALAACYNRDTPEDAKPKSGNGPP